MLDQGFVSDKYLIRGANSARYTGYTADELRLSLFELLLKANAGYRNSHTEEAFMKYFLFLRSDRTLNAKGRRFILSLGYKHSNNKADIYGLISRFRKG